MSNDPNWASACSAIADGIEAECSTDEGGDGVARAQSQIAELTALKARFEKFIRV